MILLVNIQPLIFVFKTRFAIVSLQNFRLVVTMNQDLPTNESGPKPLPPSSEEPTPATLPAFNIDLQPVFTICRPIHKIALSPIEVSSLSQTEQQELLDIAKTAVTDTLQEWLKEKNYGELLLDLPAQSESTNQIQLALESAFKPEREAISRLIGIRPIYNEKFQITSEAVKEINFPAEVICSCSLAVKLALLDLD